jgi:hypothetical protein
MDGKLYTKKKLEEVTVQKKKTRNDRKKMGKQEGKDDPPEPKDP